jgi:hypothetical protein
MRTSAFVLLLVAGLASAAMDDTDGTCVAHVSSACNDLGIFLRGSSINDVTLMKI